MSICRKQWDPKTVNHRQLYNQRQFIKILLFYTEETEPTKDRGSGWEDLGEKDG